VRTVARPKDNALLRELGGRIRDRRRALALSQVELAERSGVSRRFLVQLELGAGNPTVMRLADVCEALAMPLGALFQGQVHTAMDTVALVGLRGAGKSTVGQALATKLKMEFVELDERVEREAGMSTAEIFEFRGPTFYRELEASVLDGVLSSSGSQVVAVGGGLVTAPASWRRLRELSFTVWLSASPSSHLLRVRAQGDLRPMAGRPDALDELSAILRERTDLYSMAAMVVDTDALGVGGSVDAIAARMPAET